MDNLYPYFTQFAILIFLYLFIMLSAVVSSLQIRLHTYIRFTYFSTTLQKPCFNVERSLMIQWIKVRPCLYSLKPFIKLRRRPILVVVPAGAKLQLIISWVQRREFHECNSSTLLLKLQSPGEIIINFKNAQC